MSEKVDKNKAIERDDLSENARTLAEKHAAISRVKRPKFNLSSAMITLLNEEPFFACVSRSIAKVPTRSIPTAAMGIHPHTLRPVMYYNPNFFFAMADEEVVDVVKHEFYHLILQHVTDRLPPKKWMKLWNIGTDLAINSWLSNLPEGGLIPGEGMFADFEKGLSADKYISLLLNDKDKLDQLGLNEDGTPKPCPICEGSGQISMDDDSDESESGSGGGESSDGHDHDDDCGESCGCSGGDDDSDESESGSGGQGGNQSGQGPQGTVQCPGCSGNGFDDHSLWGNQMSEEEKEIAREKLKSALRDAAIEANSNGWGTVPQQMQKEIGSLFKSQLNWRAILRQFVQASQRSDPYSSIRKINRRYPYIHSGRSKRRVARLAVSIDQSGSVGDKLLTMFFTELNSLSKYADFVVIPFDHEVHEDKIFEWKKGERKKAERVACGGTNFNAPTAYVNEAGVFDGHIILTDMMAPKPIRSRVSRLWVTEKRYADNPYFEPDEKMVAVTIDT